MKLRRISDLRAAWLTKEMLLPQCDAAPMPQKDDVLRYLKQFEDCAFTSQPVYDVMTGEKAADADNAITDGEFTWYRSDIYYLERYDLKLRAEFLRYLEELGVITV